MEQSHGVVLSNWELHALSLFSWLPCILTAQEVAELGGLVEHLHEEGHTEVPALTNTKVMQYTKGFHNKKKGNLIVSNTRYVNERAAKEWDPACKISQVNNVALRFLLMTSSWCSRQFVANRYTFILHVKQPLTVPQQLLQINDPWKAVSLEQWLYQVVAREDPEEKALIDALEVQMRPGSNQLVVGEMWFWANVCIAVPTWVWC